MTCSDRPVRHSHSSHQCRTSRSHHLACSKASWTGSACTSASPVSFPMVRGTGQHRRQMAEPAELEELCTVAAASGAGVTASGRAAQAEGCNIAVRRVGPGKGIGRNPIGMAVVGLAILPSCLASSSSAGVGEHEAMARAGGRSLVQARGRRALAPA